MTIEQAIFRARAAKIRQDTATEEQRVELARISDECIKVILRELPSIRCKYSNLNVDIAIW